MSGAGPIPEHFGRYVQLIVPEHMVLFLLSALDMERIELALKRNLSAEEQRQLSALALLAEGLAATAKQLQEPQV